MLLSALPSIGPMSCDTSPPCLTRGTFSSQRQAFKGCHWSLTVLQSVCAIPSEHLSPDIFFISGSSQNQVEIRLTIRSQRQRGPRNRIRLRRLIYKEFRQRRPTTLHPSNIRLHRLRQRHHSHGRRRRARRPTRPGLPRQRAHPRPSRVQPRNLSTANSTSERVRSVSNWRPACGYACDSCVPGSGYSSRLERDLGETSGESV